MNALRRLLPMVSGAVLMLPVLMGCTAASPGDGSVPSSGLGELVSCAHNESGDMNGNYYKAELRAGEDGGLVLSVAESPDHMTPITVREYRADADALDRLRAIIDKHGMTAWDDLPLSEFFPLDAAGDSIEMEFAPVEPGGFPEWLSVDWYSELPEGGPEAYKAFVGCLMQWQTDDRFIREYVREDVE